MCSELFRGIKRWVIGRNLLSCDKGVSWVCTVNVNAIVNADSMASYCSLYKESTFWKSLLPRQDRSRVCVQFHEWESYGRCWLGPVLGKQVLKISTYGLKTKTKLFFIHMRH